MKARYLLVVLCLFLSSASFAQGFQIGQRDSVHSEILKQQRDLVVYLPPAYYSSEGKEFPVLYIVDGDYNFRYVSGLLELEGAISERIPQMILVAISGEGTKTYRKNSKPALSGVEDKGNADKMAEFLASELVPYVDANYKTGDFKILAGHSIGGLFVINTALHHPQLFDRYIAIRPALWWEGNAINRVAAEKVDGDFKTKVYVSLGQQRNMGVDSFLAVATGSVLKSTWFLIGLAALCILAALIWGARRKKILLPVLLVILGCGTAACLYFLYYPQDDNFAFQRFPAENHNSVGEPTYRWALEDIFATWRKDPPYFTSTERFVAHYAEVEDAYGSTFNIPSGVLGYTLYFMPRENPGELAAWEARLQADFPQAYLALRLLQAKKLIEEDTEKSAELVAEVLRLDPESVEALNIMARIKLQQGEPLEAKELAIRALQQAGQQHARQWQRNQLIETREMIDAAQEEAGS